MVFKKGHKGYWLGKKRSKETMLKVSIARLGKHYSPSTEFKKGHISWIKGKHHSIKSIKKNRLAHLGKHPSKETLEKMKKYIGKKSHGWKGGKTKTDGYLYIYSPKHPFKTKGKYVLKHRLVMEKYIGRYLLPTEIVHHINENTQDNRIKNLFLCKNKSEHRKFHNPREGC